MKKKVQKRKAPTVFILQPNLHTSNDFEKNKLSCNEDVRFKLNCDGGESVNVRVIKTDKNYINNYRKINYIAAYRKQETIETDACIEAAKKTAVRVNAVRFNTLHPELEH